MSNQTGTLYVVATPIGNLEDISTRALKILETVDHIAAEDSRHSKKLLSHFLINSRIISHHKFNERRTEGKLIKFLESGQNIALISDAGTPLISDPGYGLVKLCHKLGIRVIPIPGASAITTALSVAGMPADRFVFEGFIPDRQTARRRYLQGLINESRTMVFYEAPHRICRFMADLVTVFGNDRLVTVARELTKRFETVHQGTTADILQWIENDVQQQKGEFVIIVAGAVESPSETTLDESRLMGILLDELPLKQAAVIASRIGNKSRNELYQLGLAMKKGRAGPGE